MILNHPPRLRYFAPILRLKGAANATIFAGVKIVWGAVYGMQGIQPERLNAEGEARVLLAGG